MTETKRNIKELKESMPRVREKVIAMLMMLVISLSMIASVSYAWYTLSFAPEATEITTTIVGNGSLEIALAGRYDANGKLLEPDDSGVSDSFSATGQTVVNANLTWGNLLNLGGSYGIENIILRPATFDASSKFFLSSVSYTEDGRVENDAVTDFAFTTWTLVDEQFGDYDFTVSGSKYYGIRAISSVGYGDSGKSPLQKRLEVAQSLGAQSVSTYNGIMENEDYISTLRDVIQTYLYAEMYKVLSSSDDWKYQMMAGTIESKSSDVLSKDQVGAIAGIYRELNDAVEELGDAFVYLANVHQYMEKGEGNYEPYTMETLFTATAAELKANGVQISSEDLSDYITVRNRVANDKEAMEGLYNRALDGETIHLCDQTADDGTTIASEILPVVNNLIDINTVRIADKNGTTHMVGNLMKSMGTAVAFISALDDGGYVYITAYNGDLKNYEDLTGAKMDDGKAGTGKQGKSVALTGLELVIKSNITGYMSTSSNQNKFGSAVTDTMDRDSNLTANMVAKETYGMVIDLWLRTNAENSILTLDGLVSSTTEYVPSKVVLSGESESRLAYIYKRPTTVALGEGTYATEDVVAYRDTMKDADGNVIVDDNGDPIYYYFSADSRSVLYLEELVTVNVTDDEGNIVYEDDGVTPQKTMVVQKVTENGEYVPLSDAHLEAGQVLVQKFDEIVTVTGFSGSNRVYDDLYVDTAGGEISATQGSGSCFIFYPSSPEEADSTLELLRFLKIAFVSEDSKLLAQAYFDVDHVFATSGKYIVPLVISAGTCSYEDENGNICYGITVLEKNEATLISAVVYLEGKGLENSMAMSDSITSGSLNLQFATTEDIESLEDSALQMQTIHLSSTLSKSGYDFTDADIDKQVSISAVIEGLSTNADTRVEAYFQRKINAAQGTQMKAITLTNISGDVWGADFTFNMPGVYELRSLWVNGVEYALPNTLTLTVTGFTVNSVSFCNATTDQLALTADTYVTRPVSVTFSAAWTPENVSARIVSETGTYISVPLTYNTSTRSWDGLARFVESGTYTIQYLYLSGTDEDGEAYEIYYELDEEYRNSLTAYLGLTVKIMLNDSWNNQSFIFDNEEDLTVSIKAEILTNTGTAMKGLTDIDLYYHLAGSGVDGDGLHAELEWNDGYYTGTFDVSTDGQFAFDRLKVGTNVIKVATRAPIINARNISSVEFISSNATGLIIAKDGESAYYVANIKNASAPNSVTAILVAPDGTEYPVTYIPGNDSSDDAYRQGDNFYFRVDEMANESSAGTWTVKEIRLDGVFYVPAGGDTYFYYGTDGVTEARADYYSITHTGNSESEEKYSFTVLDDISVSVTGATLGKDENGNITANFMEGQYATGVEVTVDNSVLSQIGGEVTGIEMQIYLYHNNEGDLRNEMTLKYGSYTYVGNTGYETRKIVFKQENGEWVVDTDNSDLIYIAGTYGIRSITVTVNDQHTFTKAYGDFTVLTVYSAAPTVTISSVNTNASTDRYYTSATPGETEYENMITGSFNSKIDNYNAVVYMYFVEQSNYDNEATIIKYPIVTLGLSGVPNTHSGVTMVFDNDSNSSSACTFTFAAGATTASSSQTAGNRIGGGVNGSMGSLSAALQWIETYPVLYPAGEQTVQTITVTYGGVTYTVTLSDAVTINNPLYPPYATFNSTASGQTLPTTPSTIYGTPNADGTFTITLPGSQTWTEAKSSTTTQDFTVQSGYPQTATVYYTWSETTGGGCNATTTNYYLQYTKTTTVSVAASTTSTWTRTWKITGWRVGNTTYAVGETITIEGHQTFTPVLSYTDGTKSTSSSTTTRTEYYYTQVGEQQTGTPSGTTISDSERTYTETNPYQNDVTTSG